MPIDNGIDNSPPPETPNQPPKKVLWHYTGFVGDHLEGKNPNFNEEGPERSVDHIRFQGRPLIHRDSPINGGVYLVGGSGEAIVVDDQKQQLLQEEYYALLNRINQKIIQTGHHFNQLALSEVYQLVQESLPYSQVNVTNLHREYNIQDDQKIALEVYIQRKAGICRHQALLGAYLLERLAKTIT